MGELTGAQLAAGVTDAAIRHSRELLLTNERLRARIKELEGRNAILERFATKLCCGPTTPDALDFWATEYLHALGKLDAIEEIEARIQTLKEALKGCMAWIDQAIDNAEDEAVYVRARRALAGKEESGE